MQLVGVSALNIQITAEKKHVFNQKESDYDLGLKREVQP